MCGDVGMLHALAAHCQPKHHALFPTSCFSINFALKAAFSAALLIGRQISGLGHALGEMVRTISV
ncbi:hypothetical protein Xant_21505 [Xanthomonas cissicola]|uniref:Uncharacterized protein n=2 Tax=Xanthomonas TaxID=338 RepID=A0ABX3M4C3_9XANT|nr:hypothetical protein Xant_21505 [Xanthomonas cissicola]